MKEEKRAAKEKICEEEGVLSLVVITVISSYTYSNNIPYFDGCHPMVFNCQYRRKSCVIIYTDNNITNESNFHVKIFLLSRKNFRK
jgi:hypothetical protein